MSPGKGGRNGERMSYQEAVERLEALRAAKQLLLECRTMGGDMDVLARVSVRLNYELYEAQDAIADCRAAGVL